MKLRKSINLAVALVVLGHQVSISALASDYLSANTVADLRLKRGVCVTIGFHAPLRNRSIEQMLISIDGENLRNNSFDQIKKKLAGPSGSVVRVEFAHPNGDIESEEILREFPKSWQEQANVDSISMIDRLFSPNSSSPNNLLEYSADSTDLIGKLKCAQALDASETDSRNRISFLVKCMLLSQAIGDFDAAEGYLKLVLDSLKRQSTSNMRQANSIYREAVVVQNLIAVGKYAEAEEICKFLSASRSAGPRHLPADVGLLEAYSLIPTKSAQAACRELAKRIVSENRANKKSALSDSSVWFAQYLESLGWYKEAIEVYSKEYEALKMRPTYVDLAGPQLKGFCLYSRARLEAKMGRKEQAKKDLQELIRTYKAMLPKQQELLNRIPEFFPTFTDIEKAKSALSRSATAIIKPPRLRSDLNQDPNDSEGVPAYRLQFPLAISCFALIKKKDEKGAMAVAEKLIGAYRESIPATPFRYVRQNLFCTCLRIIRAFADSGWYDSCESLLTELEAAAKKRSPQLSSGNVAFTMIIAERAYCSHLARPEDVLDWSLLESTISDDAKRRRANTSLAHRLRELALAFAGAAEQERAKFFIDQAMNELNSTVSINPNLELTKLPSDCNAAIYFDAAYIYAKSGEFSKADKYLEQAFRLPCKVDDSLSALLSSLATVYSDSGLAHRAISVLEKVEEKFPSRMDRIDGESAHIKLVKFYRQSRQPAKALRLVKRIISDSNGSPKVEVSRLMAELSEEMGQYSDAANYYYEAGRFYNTFAQPERERLLKNALRCAARVPGYDRSRLSKVYVALADMPCGDNLSNSLAYRKKAVELLSDTDPEKAKQLSTVGYVEELLAESRLKSSKASSPSKKSAYDTRIATARKAAELASRSKSKDASDYWLRLAYAEVEAGRVDDAVADARRAIAAYGVENAKYHSISTFIHPGFCLKLAHAGYPEKAESILKEADAKVASVAGEGSMPAQAVMANHFEYLVRVKDYTRAEKLLKSFLRTDLNQGRYAPPNHDLYVCGVGPYPIQSSMDAVKKVLQVAKQMATVKRDAVVALRFLNEILAVELKQFSKDDYRVGLTYATIAQVHFAAGQNRDAYEAFEKAKAIMHKYEGIMWVLSSLGSDYYSVLRKVGKQSEIEKMESLKLEEQRQRQLRHMRPRRN